MNTKVRKTTGKKQEASETSIGNAGKWHALLADYFTAQPLFSDDEKKEAPNLRKCQELPFQELKTEGWDQAVITLCDLWFVEAKIRCGLLEDLQSDYKALLSVLPDAKEERHHKFLKKKELKDYVIGVIAYASGEQSSLPVITSRLNEQSMVNKRKADKAYITDRLYKLKAFSLFILTQAHFLDRYVWCPGFVIQQAFNYAESGPCSEAAEAIIEKNPDRPMVLNHPNQRQPFTVHPELSSILSVNCSGISDVVISQNGRRAVVITYDGFDYWDLEKGSRIFSHQSKVRLLRLSPDGRWMVVEDESTLSWWDMEKKSCIVQFETAVQNKRSSIDQIEIAADGQSCITTGREWNSIEKYDVCVVHRWRLSDGKALKRYVFPDLRDGKRLSITPDGKRAVFVSNKRKGEKQSYGYRHDYYLVALNMTAGDFDEYLIENKFVYSISLTPDGRLVLFGGRNKQMSLWDLEYGHCRSVFYHGEDVDYVSISADGKTAVSFSNENIMRVWDLDNRACFKEIKRPGIRFNKGSMTPDVCTIITENGKDLLVWDLTSNESFRIFESHDWEVSCIDLGSDSKSVTTGDNRGFVKLWDMQSCQCLKTLKEDDGDDTVQAVRMNPSLDRLLVQRFMENGCTLWDLESDAVIRHFPTSRFYRCAMDIQGNRVAIWDKGEEKAMTLWDAVSGEFIRKIRPPDEDLNCRSLMFTADGSHLFTGIGQSVLMTIDVETGTIQGLLKMSGVVNYNLVRISPDGTTAVLAESKQLEIWDLKKQICSRRIPLDYTPDFLAVTDRGKQVFSGGDKYIHLWDGGTGKCIRELRSDGILSIRSMAVTPDGSCAVTGCYHDTPFGQENDNRVLIWDVRTGTVVMTLGGHSKRLACLAVSDDKKYLFLATDQEKTIEVWDLNTGSCTMTLEGHHDPVRDIFTTADSRRIVSRSNDSIIRWDLEKGTHKIHEIQLDRSNDFKCICLSDGKTVIGVPYSSRSELNLYALYDFNKVRTIAHAPYIWGFDIDREAKTAIILSDHNPLKLWDVTTGEVVQTYGGFTMGVDHIRLPSGEKEVISISKDDGKLNIRDIARGQCRLSLSGLPGSYQIKGNYACSADGKTAAVITTEPENTLKILNLETGECRGELHGNCSSLSMTKDGFFAITGTKGNQHETLRVWDLKTMSCVAIYPLNDNMTAVPNLDIDSYSVVGTRDGEVLFLKFAGIHGSGKSDRKT